MNSLQYASVWDLGLPATPADMSPENMDYGLSDMVRAGYLAKLRETLMVNIKENTASDRGSAEDGTIEMFVEKCLGEMEKEAIRKCMVAEIYCDAMRKTIDEVKICTGTSTIHDRLMTTIIAQSDNRNHETASTMEVAVVDIDERQQNCGDAYLLQFPTQAQVFDQQDEQAILTLAIENFNRTSMFPGMPTEDIVDPNTVRPEMIDIVKNDKNLSAMVATTHEFRRNMRRLPHAMRARIDKELNQVFDNCFNPEYQSIFLSLEEERVISYERIKLLVSDRMRPYFEYGPIIKSSEFEILVRLISRTMMESASDPTESTINQIIDGFFIGHPYKTVDHFIATNCHFFQSDRPL
ncbi:uncharacterized protein LOC112681422 [Sipha flava]|uniref:Uncharacterized protein LOC112681422 n=1 Tax=Sipha flava TaxID=143950 RepID=A0A8B8F9K1_9HEMI|nr:uncharacterized protein LOC112681422 [Sipha flava]